MSNSAEPIKPTKAEDANLLVGAMRPKNVAFKLCIKAKNVSAEPKTENPLAKVLWVGSTNINTSSEIVLANPIEDKQVIFYFMDVENNTGQGEKIYVCSTFIPKNLNSSNKFIHSFVVNGQEVNLQVLEPKKVEMKSQGTLYVKQIKVV